jgi:hypothetical protein
MWAKIYRKVTLSSTWTHSQPGCLWTSHWEVAELGEAVTVHCLTWLAPFSETVIGNDFLRVTWRLFFTHSHWSQVFSSRYKHVSCWSLSRSNRKGCWGSKWYLGDFNHEQVTCICIWPACNIPHCCNLCASSGWPLAAASTQPSKTGVCP